ncbi:MAG TPA: riboflavin synthase [Pseudogracilibacillus sp.]|nr:riboflavin synthase [Pseudogracilibacillus sp.]
MFTGIVEEVGIIKAMKKTSHQAIQLDIAAEVVIEDVHIGDSIAVNGVCLTVTTYNEKIFTVDVMPETIKATSLNALKVQSPVNLERAMAANGRFGGHFVSGHVDGTGMITKKEAVANAIYYDIHYPSDLRSYFIKKGSVAIDGISLTIFDVKKDSIQLSLIPHTANETTLGDKGTGEVVNIECDMLLKHVHHLLQSDTTIKTPRMDKQFFMENGF